MTKSATTVYVFPVGEHEPEIKVLKKLIAIGGCEVICPSDPPDAYEHCVNEADVIVILICPETQASAFVDQAVDLANKLGKRVVGVWANTKLEDKVPSSLHRHGNATITLDAEAVARAVCNDEPIWTTPTGGARPKPKTPRHKG